MTTSTQAPTAPRPAVLDHGTAMRLAATEYYRVFAALRRLAPADWHHPTDCTEWDVHAMASHVLGMTEMAASLRVMVRQQRAAARLGGGIDALTAVQVDERRGLTPDQIVERLAAAVPHAVRSRRRVPALVRRRTLPERQVVGDRVETWTIGYLLDVILTRDPWMHRVDLARAVGQPMQLSADHDGVIVADLVAEWAGGHGQSYDLQLTGPAGGHWSSGADGPAIEMDAIEFCRALALRAPAAGLLAYPVAV